MEGPNFQAGLTYDRQIPGVEHVRGAAPMKPVFRSRRERLNRFCVGSHRWCVVNRLNPPAGGWRINKISIDSRKRRRIRAASTRIPGPRVLRRSGTGKPALRPQRPACLTALEQRFRTITVARSAMATRQQRHPKATHRSTTDDRLPEATIAWRHASLEASHRGFCCSPLPVRSLPVPHRLLSTVARPPIPRITPDGRGEFPLQSPPPERLRPR